MERFIPNFEDKCNNLMECPHKFTRRESESVVMVSENFRYKDISDCMGVKESTVRQFMSTSREKTRCASNEAMVLLLAKYLY